MTLNLCWSDGHAAYLVVDSARTHSAAPREQVSSLGQLQRSDSSGLSVDEGAQKIVRLGNSAAALCGSVADLRDFLAVARAVAETGDTYALVEYAQCDLSRAHIKLTIASLSDDEPFSTYCLPEKKIIVTKRGDIFVTGSLNEALRNEVTEAISELLGVTDPSAPTDIALNLVIGLALMTTTAVQHNLSEHHIGGSFYGAFLNADGFHWQPDIVYLLYSPGSYKRSVSVPADDIDAVVDGVPKTHEIFDIIQTWVRGDAMVCSSSITDAGLVSLSDASPVEVERWASQWLDELRTAGLGQTDFFVLVPKGPGPLVVLRNTGRHIQCVDSSFLIGPELIAALEGPCNGKKVALIVM
jgi:hypothetical protein